MVSRLKESGHRRRVLAIDDDPMVLRVVQRILSRLYDVTVTTVAKQALGWIGDGERFDVILCDLLMPEMTGIAFHSGLAQLVPHQAQNVLFFTAAADFPIARAFLEEVPNGCLRKPFEPAALLRMVHDRLHA